MSSLPGNSLASGHRCLRSLLSRSRSSGSGCRLPGGIVGPESYWDFLVGAGDGISEVPSDRWDADEFYDPDPAVPGRMTTKWGGFISDVAGFDAEFFGISPREAQATDPQQRVLLEVAWEALEHAGIPPDSLLGSRTAVMAGLSTWDYMLVSVEHRAEIDAYLSTGIPHSSAVGRISYQLGLRGPAVAVDTACSSSLVAVHLACQSLRLRESDLALAGGVQLNLSPYIGIALSKYSALSRVGRCKAFDAAADGFVQSEGCGMVVLKRLTDAQRDGDRVLSVLRGSAINSDGRSNGMTAPNAAAQREVIIDALRAADVAADTVNYVEAHGTGTPLGDPVEFEGLASTYGRGQGVCVLGAVKSNLGHMEAAGGVAGLIKATMALRHGEIPANLHFNGWNPAIDASSTRFLVPSETVPWPAAAAPRRAAVSSFGFSGTNAHVVLEQAAPSEVPRSRRQASVTTLVVSGKTPRRLASMSATLVDWMEGDGADVPLPDVAHTLNEHRTRHRHIAAVCARDRTEAMEGLRALAANQPAATVVGPRDIRCGPRTVFVYSGQGSEWAGMGRQLLVDEPVFAAAIRELEPEFRAQNGFSLSEVLASGEDVVGIDRIEPVLVGIQLALTRLWRHYGVEPDAVMGHSVGEVTAAVVSGGLGVTDGLRAHRLSELRSTLADLTPSVPTLVFSTEGIKSAGRTYGTFIEVSPHPLLTETIEDALGSVDHEVLSSMDRNHHETLHFHLQLAALATQPGRSMTSIATGGRLADIPRTPWHHVTHWLTDRAAGSASDIGDSLPDTDIEVVPAGDDGLAPGPQVLLLSAESRESVNRARAALAEGLAGDDHVNIADVAFTLASRRKDMTRMAAVVHDRPHAVTVLQDPEHENAFVGEAAAAIESPLDRVVFVFPGQGAQYAGMALGLYETEPVFADHFDRCAAGFLDELGIDLRTEIFNGVGSGLERTDRAQPALFTVEYALAKLIGFYGVRAAALCGHSIGEFVAAALAGVFDLETAISAVSLRARLMHASPAGAMLAVPLGPDAIAEHLPRDVDVAAINDHGSCVVAGTKEGIRALASELSRQGITVRRVRTAHGFHSRSMDAVLPEFDGFLSTVALRKPEIPLLSNVTGTWLTDDEATNHSIWTRQVRATVRFADELDALLVHPSRVLVEVGPGGSLTASAVRHPRWSYGHRAVRLMRHPTQNRDDRDVFLLGLGQLWAADIDIDWTSLMSGRRPRTVSLPADPSPREKQRVVAGDNAAPEKREHDQSHIESALQGIVAECLGLRSVDVNADFFDIGADSLIAAGVAMRAVNEGLDVTPQDLYEHPTVTRLAKAVAGRYQAGGLTHKPPSHEVNPPVPPNIAQFLERGLQEAGRWRVPMILRLHPSLGPDDVRAVLTALTNEHDALRLNIVERAGTWEQQIALCQEFSQLSVRSLAEEVVGDRRRERESIVEILAEIGADQTLVNAPLAAVYVAASAGDAHYLGITLHETACDNAAREILIADMFTAFAQRFAGEEIKLQPATATWREWSQQCAELAAHPAVIASRDYWLENVTSATMRLADDRVTERPRARDTTRVSSSLTTDQTAEVDDARRRSTRTMDAILLGALSRTLAQVIGEGVVAVDLDGAGRSVLKPDVDLRRSVGWFTTIYPVPLTCATEKHTGAIELLDSVHQTLSAVPHYGIGYGLLRYLFAPTARHLAGTRTPDIHFSYLGTIPVPLAGDGPIDFDSEIDMPVRETIPGLGHAVEVRVYRFSGALHVDWWYDTRRVERATVEALAQHYPVALTELTRQASESISGDNRADGALAALTLVDLSATDTG